MTEALFPWDHQDQLFQSPIWEVPSYKFLGIAKQSQSIPDPPQHWQSTRHQLCYFLVTGNDFAVPACWETSGEAATDSLMCHNNLLPMEKLMPNRVKEGQIKRIKMGEICVGSSWTKGKTKEWASGWIPLLWVSPMLFKSLPTCSTNLPSILQVDTKHK